MEKVLRCQFSFMYLLRMRCLCTPQKIPTLTITFDSSEFHFRRKAFVFLFFFDVFDVRNAFVNTKVVFYLSGLTS